MGRVTINPFGAESRYDGLGLTGFYDYGYTNTCTPDPNALNATCGHIARAAGIAHYTAETWGVIAEWDYGHNAFSPGNLYSGSGPSDAIGIASPGGFAGWNNMVGDILNSQAVQMGADLMGHYDIPYTPFTTFGLLQWFQPNTRIQKDPLDFTRYDVGVQWLINKYLRVALDSQAIQYYHSQFTFPAGSTSAHSKAVPFAVARDTHGVLPAPGVQILVASQSAGASIRNARAGSRFGSPRTHSLSVRAMGAILRAEVLQHLLKTTGRTISASLRALACILSVAMLLSFPVAKVHSFGPHFGTTEIRQNIVRHTFVAGPETGGVERMTHVDALAAIPTPAIVENVAKCVLPLATILIAPTFHTLRHLKLGPSRSGASDPLL